MTIQIGLLTKASVTQRTLEWFFLVVNIPHVTLQIAGNAETPLAILALVGLLSGVGPQVTGQVGRAWEYLSAELARVSLSVFDHLCRQFGAKWVSVA